MEIKDRIWLLISRKLTGEISETELRELNKFIRENPGMQSFMEFVTAFWKTGVQTHKAEAEQAFSRHMNRMKDLTRQHQEMKSPIWEKKTNIGKSLYQYFNLSIFNNYFKVIYRNLYRFKTFSVINITGLAIGMASAILILLLIQNELSFDQFHEKKDRIYMLFSRAAVNGRVELFGTPSVLAPELKANFPQVEEMTRLNGTGPIVLSANDKQLEVKGMMVDPGFLKIFSYPLLRGNPDEALSSPRSIVLTESFAKKLFTNGDAMGKLIRIDSNSNFAVTGIMKDLPNNTEFHFEYLLPWSYMKEVGWENPGHRHPIDLRELQLEVEDDGYVVDRDESEHS